MKLSSVMKRLVLASIIYVITINPAQSQLETAAAVMSVIPVTSLLSTAGIVGLKLALISRLLGLLGLTPKEQNFNISLGGSKPSSASPAPSGQYSAGQSSGDSTYAAVVPLNILDQLGLHLNVQGQTGAYRPPNSNLPPYSNYPAYSEPASYDQYYQNNPNLAAGYAVNAASDYLSSAESGLSQSYAQPPSSSYGAASNNSASSPYPKTSTYGASLYGSESSNGSSSTYAPASSQNVSTSTPSSTQPFGMPRQKRDVSADKNETSTEKTESETTTPTYLPMTDGGIDIGRYFAFIRSMDDEKCLAKMVCEIGAQPPKYGAYGINVNNFFANLHSEQFNSTNVDYYLDAYRLGKTNNTNTTDVCNNNFASCTEDMGGLAKTLNSSPLVAAHN